jgi:DNA excision repair protein ERCC-4
MVAEVAAPEQAATEDFVVCPFTVAVDSREQEGWTFRGLRADARDKNAPIVVRTERATLRTGDYSIVGHEGQIAIERKEKGDCFHCMGSDRDRFEKQVQRLSLLPHGYVIVEADWLSVFAGHPNSQLKPKVIHRTVISWQMRYPSVRWWLCPTRAFAEATAFRILDAYWRKFCGDRSISELTVSLAEGFSRPIGLNGRAG